MSGAQQDWITSEYAVIQAQCINAGPHSDLYWYPFPEALVTTLNQLIDVLAMVHGEKRADWPTDPYLFLVWLHCGYPASDARCAKGWESLTSQIGLDAERILAA